MTTHNISSAGFSKDTVFTARLTPYRSLGSHGFRLLMGLIGGVCLIMGLVFFMAGLWPVVGFVGLDFLALYWAFKASYRSAKAYEDVEISRQHVLVRKVSPKGLATDYRFPQFGTRFKVDRHKEIGITKMQLENRQDRVTFGALLNPADRESFASAFQTALFQAKR